MTALSPWYTNSVPRLILLNLPWSPMPRSDTLPACCFIGIPSLILIARWPAAMPPFKRYARTLITIHICGACHCVRRNAFLHPAHYGHQHILLWVRRGDVPGYIPNVCRPRSTSTVRHARDAEKAVEVIQ